MTTETFTPENREEWRKWLKRNHSKKESIWLVYYKKSAEKSTVTYSEAVDEALCFGWIDSKAKPVDAEKYMQYFSRRKSGSVWSKVNKEKVQLLIADGRMTAAGLEVIERARQDGSWTILDNVEALKVPDDLNEAFNKVSGARNYFEGLSRSDKRNILQWLVLAKRQNTRERRVAEIVELAGKQQKPKQFR